MDYIKAIQILRTGETLDGVDCLSASDALGNGNSCEVETGEFLRTFAKRMKPKMVIHTGCHVGYDVAWIAVGLMENGIYPSLKGHIVTIDSHDYDGEPENLWGQLGLDNITHIIGDSREAASYHGRIRKPAQWAHLDADHSEESVLAEFHCLLPYMDSDHCIISSHDTRLDVRTGPAMVNIYKELKALRDKGNGWQYLYPLPIRNLRGIDFIFLSNHDYGYEVG